MSQIPTAIVTAPGDGLATLLIAAGALLTVGGLLLAFLIRRLRRATGASLRRVRDPREFERRVADAFRAKGYRVHNRRHSSDHGVDLVVRRGRERAVVQCKLYSGTVGEPVVRDLVGAMVHERAKVGYVVTSGRFSEPARRWARGKRVRLIDGESPWWWRRPLRGWPMGVALLGVGLLVGGALYLAADSGAVAWPVPGSADPPAPTATAPQPTPTDAPTATSPSAGSLPGLPTPTPERAVR